MDRALRALSVSGNSKEFEDSLRRLTKEDMRQLLDKLPADRKADPKTFYRIVKTVGGLNSQSTLVKGFIDPDDGN